MQPAPSTQQSVCGLRTTCAGRSADQVLCASTQPSRRRLLHEDEPRFVDDGQRGQPGRAAVRAGDVLVRRLGEVLCARAGGGVSALLQGSGRAVVAPVQPTVKSENGSARTRWVEKMSGTGEQPAQAWAGGDTAAVVAVAERAQALLLAAAPRLVRQRLRRPHPVIVKPHRSSSSTRHRAGPDRGAPSRL